VKGEPVPSRSRWIGKVLRDRWRIDERISRGGVGTVYAATHKNNGSRAAIKVLHPEFARDPDTRSRFLQEGYAANQVNHPGVVRILDDDTSEEGHPFLVMELLEGELLESRRTRKGGSLPLHEIYEVGEQLLDVLAAAHDKGIVHRDIKPENLFITREGRLKVLDFGFAQMKSGFRKEQTATGFLLGTPGFMSPEQAVGNRAQVDAKTDIWAAGATLFTLISGEPVHDGKSAAEMLVAAANFPPRSLATVVSALPRGLVALVDRAVAFDKKDRWPNARAMQAALRDVAARAPGGASYRPPVYSIPDRGELGEPEDIEELDSVELVSASASWPANPVAERHLHPADEDDRTLTQRSAAAGEADLPRSASDPDPLVDPSADAGTLIMENAPPVTSVAPARPRPSAHEPAYTPTAPPSRGLSEPPRRASDPELHEAAAARAVRTGPNQAMAPAPRGSRVLVFLGVAVVTMVVVIVTGLVVLALTD